MTDTARFRLEGAKELQRALSKLGKDMKPENVLRSGAIAGAAVVRKKARTNLAPHKDTGALAKNIKTSSRIVRAQQRIVVKIKPHADQFYGVFLEFGTKYISPKRWLSRAVRENHREILAAMTAKIRARIERTKAKKNG